MGNLRPRFCFCIGIEYNALQYIQYNIACSAKHGQPHCRSQSNTYLQNQLICKAINNFVRTGIAWNCCWMATRRRRRPSFSCSCRCHGRRRDISSQKVRRLIVAVSLYNQINGCARFGNRNINHSTAQEPCAADYGNACACLATERDTHLSCGTHSIYRKGLEARPHRQARTRRSELDNIKSLILKSL